jgi:hypothetical protein
VRFCTRPASQVALAKIAANEKDVPDKELVKFIVRWPGKWPKGAKGKPR